MSEIPDELIDAMCLTWRHDFGLQSVDGTWGTTTGLTDGEREFLRGQMRQLYQHHILPALLSERVAATKAARTAFNALTYPVSTEIDPRGYSLRVNHDSNEFAAEVLATAIRSGARP